MPPYPSTPSNANNLHTNHTVNPPERERHNGETHPMSPTRNTNGGGQVHQRKHTIQRATSKDTTRKGMRKRANIKIASLNMNGLHTVVTTRTYRPIFIYLTRCTDTGVVVTHALSFYRPLAPLFLLTHAQLAVVTQSCTLLYITAHCDLLLQ